MFLTTCRLFCLGLVFIPAMVSANTPVINKPFIPYEVLAIDANIEQEQLYLGELVGDPHMYEVTLGQDKPLTLTILQAAVGAKPLELNLIVVRSNDNERGVTEVGRLKGSEINWQSFYDQVLGFSFLRSQAVSYELQPGVYRFEISTAENLGKYMLIIGTAPIETGYLTKLKEIRFVQEFFGVSAFRILLSTYVLYPLGIIIVLILFGLTGRLQRKKIYA